jgi:hypothetical protein
MHSSQTASAAAPAGPKSENDLHPGDGGCPHGGLASKTRSQENTKNFSNNRTAREGNMLQLKDHKLRFCLPALAHYANIEWL